MLNVKKLYMNEVNGGECNKYCASVSVNSLLLRYCCWERRRIEKKAHGHWQDNFHLTETHSMCVSSVSLFSDHQSLLIKCEKELLWRDKSCSGEQKEKRNVTTHTVRFKDSSSLNKLLCFFLVFVYLNVNTKLVRKGCSEFCFIQPDETTGDAVVYLFLEAQ